MDGKLAADLKSVPMWVWLGGAGVGALLFVITRMGGNSTAATTGVPSGIDPTTGQPYTGGATQYPTTGGMSPADVYSLIQQVVGTGTKTNPTAPTSPNNNPPQTQPQTPTEPYSGITGGQPPTSGQVYVAGGSYPLGLSAPLTAAQSANGYGIDNPAPGSYESVYGLDATKKAEDLYAQGYNVPAAAAVGAGYAQQPAKNTTQYILDTENQSNQQQSAQAIQDIVNQNLNAQSAASVKQSQAYQQSVASGGYVPGGQAAFNAAHPLSEYM